MEAVGTSDGRSYNVIPRTMGTEMVCLRGVTAQTSQKLGDFLISDSVAMNDRALYYEVVKTGSDVYDISGVKEGDYVFVDALARFADTFPISFINCRNILLITDSKAMELHALRYKIITRIHEPTSEVDSSTGFIRLTHIDPYGEVVSIGEGCEDRGYRLGDRLSVTANAEMFMFRNVKYFIFDYRVPMVKFND